MTLEQRNNLIEDNVKLVYKLAHSMCNMKRGNMDDFDDVVAEGMLGLTKAADKYSKAPGVTFSTFAYSYIMGYMYNWYRDFKNDFVHIPRQLRDDIRALKASTLKDNINPYKHTELSRKRITECLRAIKSNNIEYIDSYEPDDYFIEKLNDGIYRRSVESVAIENIYLEDLLSAINVEKQRSVVEMYYLMDMQPFEIQETMHVSRQRVHYLRSNGLNKIKHYIIKSS